MQFAGFRAFMYFINPGIKFFTAVYSILYCFFRIIRSRKQFKTGLYGEQLILYIMAEDLGGSFRCVNLLGDFKASALIWWLIWVSRYRLPQMSSRKIMKTKGKIL